MYYLHYLTLLTITATVGADILLENNDTEIGLIFRARELHSWEGEGYFALVTAVNRV